MNEEELSCQECGLFIDKGEHKMFGGLCEQRHEDLLDDHED